MNHKARKDSPVCAPPAGWTCLLRLAVLFNLMLSVPLCVQPGDAFSHQGRRLAFECISLEQGLSQSTIRCIMQDHKGFMWFGTADGLNRYDGYTFRIYKTGPLGLRTSIMRAICEDRSHKLWIGTEGGGLVRFDPSTERFDCYQSDPNNPRSLSNNYVWCIHEDRSGNLWIGTEGGGLNRLVQSDSTGRGDDRASPVFVRYQHDSGNPNSLSSNRVYAIHEDRSGTLWLGTYGGGLNSLDPASGTFHHYRLDPNQPEGSSSDNISCICEDGSAALWVGTDGGGLYRLGSRKEHVVGFRHLPTNPNSLSSDRVASLCADRSGVLWIGTDGGGLNRLVVAASGSPESDAAPSFPTFVQYQNDLNDPSSLSNNHVWSLHEDRTGVLWVGTEFGGINKLDPYRRKFNHYTTDAHDPNSLNDKSVWSLCEDHAGNLWIGTRAGGLNKFDRSQNRFTYYQNEPGNPNTLSHNYLRAIYEDRTGLLWLGTDGGGLSSFDPERKVFVNYRFDPEDPHSLNGNWVYSILEDRSGTLWVGTRGGGVNRFDRATGRFIHFVNNPDDPASLSDSFVYDIYEDRTGTLWFGTFTGGLNKLVPGDSGAARATFVSYRRDEHNPRSLSHNCVLTIYEDQSGALWIGTGGGGINKFDRQTQSFTRYDETQGLANNFVYGILEDRQGQLWISTNEGLSKFNPRTGTFKNYDVRDGVQSNEFNGGAYCQGRSGEMFFGGINGFNAFHPEQVKDNPHVPPVYITDFQVFNRSAGIGGESPLRKHITETAGITLSYRQNVFGFEMVALNYTIPEKNKYKYIMEGFDAGWVQTDASHRVVSYMNLPAGKYIFRVQGSNNDGVWNEQGAAIAITITPPYWKTWWFRALGALLVIGLAHAGFRRRLKTVRMKTELRAAHNAQMSIMPHADPQVEGFEISGLCLPANEVGGDFFDYFWLDDAKMKFGIAIGDVSGKAMQSAMTAVLTNGMIHSSLGEGVSINQMMTKLNRPMYLKTERNMFTALCLALLDVTSRELKFTNAGLIEPLLKRAGTVVALQADGPTQPLGIIIDNVYQENAVPLQSGDVLILVTDGITEEQNPAKELYGEERLKQLLQQMNTAALSAKEIKEGILQAIKRFSGNSPQDDDMTIVVVKVL